MPLISLTRSLTKLFTTVLVLFSLSTFASVAHSQTCEDLFTSATTSATPGAATGPVTAAARTTRDLVDESWRLTLEQDYSAWLKDFEAAGIPVPERGIGRALYMHWKMAPEVTAPLLKVGFKIVEPTLANPNEVARFEFPETFEVLVENLVKNQSSVPGANFKLATYNESQWLPLDQKLPNGIQFGSGKDVGIEGYARMIAAGYAPLWPSRRSLLLIHDLGHITEFREYPHVFPALKTFFSRYLSEGWSGKGDYTGRAEIFNEASYILKSEKYKSIDPLLISGSTTTTSVDARTAKIFELLSQDREGTLTRVHRLTSKFNELFERHGGGARDAFNLESRFLTVETVATYVDKMMRDPSDGNYRNGAVAKDALIEFLESLEGINRQIQYTSEHILRDDNSFSESNLHWYLSYRLAQLEMAIVTQRSLKLSHVDVIQDSMLPTGVDSRTRTYFRSFQPKGSRHFEVFVGQ